MITKKIFPYFLCFFMSFCFLNVISAQDRVSKKEMKEYEVLIKNCYDENGNPLEVSEIDATRIESLFENMTEKQKRKLVDKNLPTPDTEIIGFAKGAAKSSSLLPMDAIYFVDKIAVSPEEAMKSVIDNQFRMVRKKTDEGYEFHITLF